MDTPPLTGPGGGNQPPDPSQGAPAAPGQSSIDLLINQAATQYNIPPDVLRSLLIHESGGNPNATGAAGEIGIAQFMPGTAKALGIDASDPAQAIPGAAMYLRQNMNRFGGDLASGLAAYNWGPGNVAKYGFANAPPQVKAYVGRIMGQQGVPPSMGGPAGAGVPGPALGANTPPAQPTTALAQAVTPQAGPPPVNPAMMAQAQGGLASIFAPAAQDFQNQTQKRVFGLA